MRTQGPAPVRVLVLAVHPTSVAATRLRALQYAPACAEAGVDMRLWSFLREDELATWFGRSQARRALLVVRALLRIGWAVAALARADVVIVQREALPLGPPLLELLAARLAPVVWDVDDAIWVDFESPTAGRVPRWLRATGDKYVRVCRSASEVWAGSEVLAEWCRQHSDDVHVVPTVVPVPSSPPSLPSDGTVSWIGSHSTGPFVERVLPGLADAGLDLRIEIVGAEVRPPEGVAVRVRRWSSAVEAEVLSRTRVGLYPVDRGHPLAEGKCGLKAILYMSQGIPPVVTPTTTNSVVVRHGIEGLHAEATEEWVESVSRLMRDDELWQRLSAASHRRALSEYSLDVWAPVVVERLQRLPSRRSARASRRALLSTEER